MNKNEDNEKNRNKKNQKKITPKIQYMFTYSKIHINVCFESEIYLQRYCIKSP